MEVLYDLDTNAAALCDELGVNMVRAGTAGTHPKFIAMIAELVRDASLGAAPHVCAPDCCALPRG
jgi:ferrochelatase